MPAAAPRRKIHRQLRFRLTASYVLFFTCAYAVAGLALHQVLQSDQEAESHLILDGLWSDLLKYLRFGSSGPVWRFKQDNPEQISIVTRVRNVLLVADEQGQVLEISAEYRLLEAETPAEIRRIAAMQTPVWRIRQSLHGVPYIVRAEVLSDASGRKYFVAIGRSMLVVRALGEKRGMVARLRNELGEVQAEFIGVLVNAVRSSAGGYLRGNFLATHQYQEPQSA